MHTAIFAQEADGEDAMRKAAFSALMIGVVMVGCAPHSRPTVTTVSVRPPQPGASSTCRSAMTGEVYTTVNTPCASTDTVVSQSSAAPSSPAAGSSSTPPQPTSWKERRVAVSPALQRAIEEAVRNDLKDPESARFKHAVAFKDKDGGVAACGIVNAKNSYGGYTGFTPYRAFIAESKGKYTGAGAIFGGGKYPQTFYEVSPMCDPKNW